MYILNLSNLTSHSSNDLKLLSLNKNILELFNRFSKWSYSRLLRNKPEVNTILRNDFYEVNLNILLIIIDPTNLKELKILTIRAIFYYSNTHYIS